VVVARADILMLDEIRAALCEVMVILVTEARETQEL